MRTVLVVAVIAVVGVLTFFLARDEEVTSVAPPIEPVATAVPESVVVQAPEPVARIERVEPAVLPLDVPDASTPVSQVIFDVRRDGVYASDARLEVRKGTQVVSGTVNAVGGLTLELEPGLWTVSAPRTRQREFVVTSSPQVVVLDVLTVKRITGRVVDRDQRPVWQANVVISSGECRREFFSAATFVCATLAPEVDLRVEERSQRSASVRVKTPANDVTLVAEPLHPLDFTIKGATSARIHVAHRLGTSFVRCEGDENCSSSAPTGDFTVLASGTKNDELLIARAVGTQGSRGESVVLSFEPEAPISGVVKTAAGSVVADVPLLLTPAFSEQALATTVSRLDGSFVFARQRQAATWGDGGVLPSWRVTPVVPWTGETKYVTFGDAPITVVAELPKSQ